MKPYAAFGSIVVASFKEPIAAMTKNETLLPSVDVHFVSPSKVEPQFG